MSERSEKLYLSDVIESIDAIQICVAGSDFDFFCSDRKTFAATIRKLEIIGEAIRNISDEIKVMYPDVHWQEIRSFRNKISHEYFGVDTRIVWDIVQNELDQLKGQMSQILAVIK